MPTKLSTFCDNLIEAGWLAVIILTPLYLNIYTARTYEADKIALLRTIATLMVWAWVISVIETKQLKGSTLKKQLKRPVIVTAGAFGLVYCLSTLLSLSPAISMWGDYQRAQGTYTMLSYIAVFAMLVSKLRTWQQIERLLNTIIITSLPICLYSIFEYFGFFPRLFCCSYAWPKMSTTLGNITFLSTYLALVLPITLMSLISHVIPHQPNRVIIQRGILVVCYGGALVIQLITLILVGHISSLAGIIIAIMMMSLIMMVRLKHQTTCWWYLWVQVVGLPLIIMLIFSLSYGYIFFGSAQHIDETFAETFYIKQLIWDGSLELMLPHHPLGIPGDVDAGLDSLNMIRPFIGYGPEMMFNSFYFSYPTQLPYVEKRGSTADRNQNKTMDILVTTGLVGLVTFYSFLISLIMAALKHLNMIPKATTQHWLIGCLIGGAVGGMLIAIGLDNEGSRLTMVLSLGLPFGLLSGLISYLIGLSLTTTTPKPSARLTPQDISMIGVMGSLISYLILAHFIFSIASTYLYFWICAGLLVVWRKIPPPQQSIKEGVSDIATTSNWQPSVVGQSYVAILIMSALVFKFIVPHFEFNLNDQESIAILWLFIITWFGGFVLLLAGWARDRATDFSWITILKVGSLYTILVGGVTGLYKIAHQSLFEQQLAVGTANDAIEAANILFEGMLLLYGIIIMLMMLFAWFFGGYNTKQFYTRKLWGIGYGVMLIGVGMIIGQHNINMVRADIYLKEGERYRGAKQWEAAIALHQLSGELQPFEDFYQLMLALDYQLMAQDERLEPEQQNSAQMMGETIALKARHLNPYNPDNTGNMARYYFTLGRIETDEAQRQANFEQAKQYFEKALYLAPNNVIYHNLLAQLWYIQEHYDDAIERLQTSLTIDDGYPPTWVFLGDLYLAKGLTDDGLAAHIQGLQPTSSKYDKDGIHSFADTTLDTRLNAYISVGRLNEIVTALEIVAFHEPEVELTMATIGRAYFLTEQYEKAIPYYQQAEILYQTGHKSRRSDDYTLILGDLYYQLNRLPKALEYYEQYQVEKLHDQAVLDKLADIYIKLGHPQPLQKVILAMSEIKPHYRKALNKLYRLEKVKDIR